MSSLLALLVLVAGGILLPSVAGGAVVDSPAVAVSFPMDMGNLPTDGSILVDFSNDMNPATVNTATMPVTSNGVAVPGVWSFDSFNNIARFKPTGGFAPNTSYTYTVGYGVKDLNNFSLERPISWTFHTGAGPDAFSPSVMDRDPDNGDINIPVDFDMWFDFDDTMDLLSLSGSGVQLLNSDTNQPVPGFVEAPVFLGLFLSPPWAFVPFEPLEPLTTYQMTIKGTAASAYGGQMGADNVWTFDTSATPHDPTPPFVGFSTPTNGETDVSVIAYVDIYFSKFMAPESLSQAQVSMVDDQGNPVWGIAYVLAEELIFFPFKSIDNFFLLLNTLDYGRTYTLTVSGLKDRGGAVMEPFSLSFTTEADTDNPDAMAISPDYDETGVPVNTMVTAYFSEAMDPATVNQNTFLVVDGTTHLPLAGTVSYVPQAKSALFVPAVPLSPNTVFTAVLTDGMTDPAGNQLIPDDWDFVTGAVEDLTSPRVISANPGDGVRSVGVNAHVTATFNEPMDPATITAANMTVTGPSGEVSGTVTYDPFTGSLDFNPDMLLESYRWYTVAFSEGMTDICGNPLIPMTLSFQTALPLSPPVPSASFTVSADPKVGNAVTFDASASTPAGEIIEYLWDFGDGTTGSGKVVSHIFDTAQAYRVVLTVRNRFGFGDSESKTIDVSPAQTVTAMVGGNTWHLTTASGMFSRAVLDSTPPPPPGGTIMDSGVFQGVITGLTPGGSTTLTIDVGRADYNGPAVYYTRTGLGGWVPCTTVWMDQGVFSLEITEGGCGDIGGPIDGEVGIIGAPALSLDMYFPHAVADGFWNSHVKLANPTGSTINCVLSGFDATGGMQVEIPLNLPAHSGADVDLSQEIGGSNVAYMMVEADKAGLRGATIYRGEDYAKGRSEGTPPMAAIPGQRALSYGDVYLPSIASDDYWATVLALVNFTGFDQTVAIEFNSGESVSLEVMAGEKLLVTIRDLFGEPRPDLTWARIVNQGGISAVAFLTSPEAAFAAGYSLNSFAGIDLDYVYLNRGPTLAGAVTLANVGEESALAILTGRLDDGSYVGELEENLGPDAYKAISIPGESVISDATRVSVSDLGAIVEGPIPQLVGVSAAMEQSSGSAMACEALHLAANYGVFLGVDPSATTLVLANTTFMENPVTLYAYDAAGAILDLVEVTIGPEELLAATPGEIFTKDLAGLDHIEYSSPQPLAAMRVNQESLSGLEALPASY